MLDNLMKFLNKLKKKENGKIIINSKEAAKERLHLVLMQDRANVSSDFLELMKKEIIDVIKKYIVIDEKEMDVRLTNRVELDGTNGAPALYANIPIINIKDEHSREGFDLGNEQKEVEVDKKIEKVEEPKEEKKIQVKDNREIKKVKTVKNNQKVSKQIVRKNAV